RNSEVIHAGIYYPAGSLKTQLCVEGKNLLYELCEKYSISHKRITKLVSASDSYEVEKLDAILQHGIENGVPLQMLSEAKAKLLEPNLNTSGAILSSTTGIISVHELMNFFVHSIQENNALIQKRCEVLGVTHYQNGYEVTIKENNSHSTISSEIVINAAGLFSDSIAAMVGIDINAAHYVLSYAKGSYFSVVPSKAKLVSRLIYPIPNNESLGVHAVLDVHGRLKFGPDVEYVEGPPFDFSVDENRRSLFGNAIRKYLPQISDDDLSPDMSGIRPKLQRKGEPVKDFVIVHEKERGLEGFVNLIGIESPGVTSSPAIARYVERILFNSV
ncbi:MAG: putative dehydrogenase, partial [Stygiobacter sp.]